MRRTMRTNRGANPADTLGSLRPDSVGIAVMLLVRHGLGMA